MPPRKAAKRGQKASTEDEERRLKVEFSEGDARESGLKKVELRGGRKK